MDKVIDILIPTWNNADMLIKCLESLINTQELAYEVHVLNNGDTEDDRGQTYKDFIQTRFPIQTLHVHDMGDNLGWEGALNWWWKQWPDKAKYVMAANDDIVFLPFVRHTIREMVRWMEADEHISGVGPCTNMVMGRQNLSHMELPQVFETTLLIGFCAAYRTETLEKISGPDGPWDATLPGGDDLDLSIRIRYQAGKRLLIDRGCYVHHHGFQTGRRVHGDYWNSQEMQLRTNNALIRKHGLGRWYECVNSYASRYESVMPMGDEEGDFIRKELGDGLGLRGIDVGCGHNKTIELAIGVDRVEPGTVGLTGGRRGKAAKNDIQAEAHDMPFEDNSRDYVIARHVLEHVVDFPEALDEFMRVLKPGGLLAVACPNQEVIDTMTLDAEHVHAFTPMSLSRFIIQAGFSLVKVERMNTISFCIIAKKKGVAA